MTRLISSLVLLLSLLSAPLCAWAQTADTLSLRGAPSGGTPAIVATGVDANISINLVPKGTGLVSIAGAFTVGSPLIVGSGLADQLSLAGSATGLPVSLTATGSDANIDILLTPKGFSSVAIGAPTEATSNFVVNGTPGALSIVSDGATQKTDVSIVSAGGNYGSLLFFASQGTLTAPTVPLSGNLLGSIGFGGFQTAATWNKSIEIYGVAQATWTAASTPGRIEFYTTPVGATADVLALTIGSNQSLAAGGAITTPISVTATAGPVTATATGTLPGGQLNSYSTSLDGLRVSTLDANPFGLMLQQRGYSTNWANGVGFLQNASGGLDTWMANALRSSYDISTGIMQFPGGAFLLASPPGNTVPLNLSGYSLTGSNASSLASFAGTLNTTGVVNVVKVAITDTAHGAGTKLFNLLGGASGTTSEFSVDTAGNVVLAGSVTVGSATPTAITNVRVYAPSLTPAATGAAIGTTEQTFTVTGLTTADKVSVTGPAPTALCPAVTFRVSAADTLAIGFSDLTALACTPAAGTYTIVAIRS